MDDVTLTDSSSHIQSIDWTFLELKNMEMKDVNNWKT